jgi:hypothetical protein
VRVKVALVARRGGREMTECFELGKKGSQGEVAEIIIAVDGPGECSSCGHYIFRFKRVETNSIPLFRA